mmetsp:Transcript_40738/g.97793  ORF Transcript_40738/g.97793 Transcript_40738/m.97793 type:complete len:224 (-) Transcript_40738:1309-1980(-)
MKIHQVHTDLQVALPDPPMVPPVSRRFPDGHAGLLEVPELGVASRQIPPHLVVLVLHSDRSDKTGCGLLDLLEPHQGDTAGEPYILVQRIDGQSKRVRIDSALHVALLEVIVAEQSLRSCIFLVGEVPGLLEVLRIVIQLTKRADQVGRFPHLHLLVDQLLGLILPVHNHQAVHGLPPHAQLFVHLVRRQHQAHHAHALPELLLRMPSGRERQRVAEQKPVLP